MATSGEEPDDEIGFCGFMEVVFHNILYVKNVYHKNLFTQYHRQGIPIWFCQNPQVIKYITDFLIYAEKIYKKSNEIEMVFSLCRRNGEFLEQFHFHFKVNGMADDSMPKLIFKHEDAVSICDGITTTNSLTDCNTLNAGLNELTFELRLLIDPDIELPEDDDTDFRLVAYPTARGNSLDGTGQAAITIIPLKNERNNGFEMKVYQIM